MASGGAGINKGLQKLIILGNSGVGKTSLMRRYVDQVFSSQFKTTIGADFSTKDVPVGDDMVTLQIWDTAGQERFQSLGYAFYRGSDACVLVYDVTNAQSFEKIDSWREQFITYSGVEVPLDFPFVLLGNKADADPSKHTVQQSAVKQWCDAKGGIPHFLVRLPLDAACRQSWDPLSAALFPCPRQCSQLTFVAWAINPASAPPPSHPSPARLSYELAVFRSTVSGSAPTTPPPRPPAIRSSSSQVSAKTGLNVDTGILTVVQAAAKRVKFEESHLPDNLRLKMAAPPPPSGCAC